MNTNQTATKQSGREKAIQLLEAQLKSGMRPISKGRKPFATDEKGNIRTTNEGKPIRLSAVPLTQAEKTRIQEQINNLQKKIDNQKQREHTLLVMDTIDLQEGWPKEPVKIKSGNPMRPKNPVTRLYRQIQGVYQKITS